jgi:hypothetical protein
MSGHESAGDAAAAARRPGKPMKIYAKNPKPHQIVALLRA